MGEVFTLAAWGFELPIILSEPQPAQATGEGIARKNT